MTQKVNFLWLQYCFKLMVNALGKPIGLILLLCWSFFVLGAKPEFIIEIKDHLFYPTEVIIPANTKVKLIIYNRDSTPEEFDSFDLNREKVIFANRKTTIFIGPLPVGRYQFFGEYNPNSARGTVIVQSAKVQSAKAGVNNVD